MQTLFALDNANTIRQILTALFPRLIISGIVIIGVSFAVSLGEVALTNQLSPPSTNQPIAVALLNAMHYQRPQVVTAALLILILVAGCSGLVIALSNRKCVAVVFLLFFISCSSEHEQPISGAVQIGGVGKADGRFTTPRAIATSNDFVVVIDKSGRLQKFDHDGTFLSSWELHLSGTGFPTGVSIDFDGSIWIADTHQQRILVLNQQGEELFHFGSYGKGDGQFLYPTDVAFGKDGEVFVSEYGGNERINVFDRKGEFQYSFGHFGNDEEGFIRPQSIAISPTSGNLFITDAGNHRVVERTPKGKVVRIISSAGREIGELLFPYGIVFDSDNSFIVCEFGNNRLQRFSTTGEVIEVLGGAGDAIGLFKMPWAVEKTSNGFIVADTGNNRLQWLPDMMGF
jgi:DNA-binding beta-propeller fold protein YncE